MLPRLPCPLQSQMMLLGCGSSGAGTPAFSPLSLSPSAWWDASQLVGLANTDPIDTCTDFSGNGKDATGVTTGRPTYVTNAINGLPAMLFDGVDDKLAFASLTVQEVYIVCNYLGAATFILYPGALTFASATSLFRGESGTNDWRSNGGADGAFSSDMFVNGTQTKDLGTLSAFSMSHGFAAAAISLAGEIGHDLGDAARFWNGYIAEILCFSASLSAGNRTLVKAYYASKYNLTIA